MRFMTLVLGILLLAGCASQGVAPEETPPPIYENLGAGHRTVTTDSQTAQAYFDQGLMLSYGYNHDEAVRAFEQAVEHDPDCAMAWWGIAFALGPNINAPMVEPAAEQRAAAAVERAHALSTGIPAADRALVEALRLRYPASSFEERQSMNKAYADAMRRVWTDHPVDPDVGALFADAMINLRPWDQWTREGKPQEGTPEAVETLEKVLRIRPDHLFANHLYIHAMEASPWPERALPAADRLGDLAPGLGHLVHMPGHIYIWTGHYDRVIDSNAAACEADHAYFEARGPQRVYEFYHAHNHHFLAYGAMFAGNKELALRHAREITDGMSPAVLSAMPEFAEGFRTVLWHVMIRFGLWEEILAEPEVEHQTEVVPAMWHYARAIALANLKRIGEARAEAAAFEPHARNIEADAKVALSPASQIVGIARLMMRGEIEFHAGRHELAFRALREAVELEDGLPYEEPRGWMQPVRHALGALLLEAGRIEEALVVYLKDLAIHRENGWSLHGLAECYRLLGKEDEAAAAEARFEAAWSRADTEISASCFCRDPD